MDHLKKNNSEKDKSEKKPALNWRIWKITNLKRTNLKKDRSGKETSEKGQSRKG